MRVMQDTTKSKLTLVQAVRLIKDTEKLFDRAANAWTRGSNSGNGEKYKADQARCQKLRKEAEALLAPFGIACDYPGLYPSFRVYGYDHYTVLSALSEVLEVKVKEVA